MVELPRVQVRRAIDDDREALLGLWDEWVAGAPHPPWVPADARAGTAAGIAASVAAGWAFAAERDGVFAGFAAAVPRGERDAELVELYVRHEERGRGLARALAAAVVGALRESGVRYVFVTTAPGSDALRLYERWGFAPESVALVAPVDDLDL